MMQATQHFRSWVPRWVQALVALVVLVPIMLLNGAYTGSNLDISGSLGVMAEDINMAYFATSAGMAMAYPIIPIIKPVATTKTIILIVLSLQLVLSLICALTSYIEILIFCSFFIGYFKGFTLSETLAMLNPFLAPSGTRNEFYSKFYPITLSCGQLSLVLTAELAYQYQWKYMYYFMIVLLLVAMLFVVVFMAFGRKLIRIPYKEIDWLSFFQASCFMMCIIYICTYGKTNDWFADSRIIAAAVIAPMLGWLFVRRQLLSDKQSFVDMSVLKNRNSVVVILFSFLMMFMASYSTLSTSYVISVLRLDSTKSNELYLYVIPGIIVGGVICYICYKKAIRMAWLIFIGFISFTVGIGYMYFTVESAGLYEDLYLPSFLKGLGLMVLFVAMGIYGIQGLRLNQLIYNAFFLIAARSALAPAVASSIITNWLYRFQQSNLSILSESIDNLNPLAMSQYNQSYTSYLAKGLSIEDAQSMAKYALYTKVQIQATTVSIKQILGYMLIIGCVILVVIVLYFFQQKAVRLIKVGNDLH